MFHTIDHYLIVDLEATCSEDETVPRHEMEIIEIGAVLLCLQSRQIVSEFSTFVKPVRHPVLTPFCTQLTTITQHDLAAAETFPAAFAKFLDWLANHPSALFCSWGDYDRNQFLQDCAYHDVAYPFQAGHQNLKNLYAKAKGETKKLGVGSALRRLGLQFEGTPHRGLDDARNIARIVCAIQRK